MARWPFPTVAFALATGCLRLEAPEAWPCEVDADCESDETCGSADSRRLHVCEKKPEGWCSRNEECDADAWCTLNECLTLQCPPGYARVPHVCIFYCENDSACAAGHRCENSRCTYVPPAPAPCSSSSDCGQGFTCTDSRCVVRECTPGNYCADGHRCTDDGSCSESCASSAECAREYNCSGGKCVSSLVTSVGEPCATGCTTGFCNESGFCTNFCSKSDECGIDEHGLRNACVSLRANVLRCFPGCSAQSSCSSLGAGFTCKTTTDVEGLDVSACLP